MALRKRRWLPSAQRRWLPSCSRLAQNARQSGCPCGTRRHEAGLAVAIPPESADVKCQDRRFVWQGPPMLRLRFLPAVSPSTAVEDCSWPSVGFLLPCGPHSCWPAPTITTRFCCRDTSSRKRSDPLSLLSVAVERRGGSDRLVLSAGRERHARSRLRACRQVTGGLTLLVCVPRYRGDFLGLFKPQKIAAVGLIGLSKTLFSVSEAVTLYATLLAPVALVLLVHSFQPLFVLGLGIVLTLFFPRVARELLGRRKLLQKGLAIGLMLVGGYLISR